MGFNECGDDNDDNYSNSFLSLCPREAVAAFCHLTKSERWPSFLSLFCAVFSRTVHCFSAFTSLQSAYAQRCARYSGGYRRKPRLSRGPWALLTPMPGAEAGACRKYQVGGRENEEFVFICCISPLSEKNLRRGKITYTDTRNKVIKVETENQIPDWGRESKK